MADSRELLPTGSEKKRKITPSALMPMEKCVLPTSAPSEPWHCRKITSFDLRDPNVKFHQDPVKTWLQNIFPTTIDVTMMRGNSHLVFGVKQLPSPPWPVTIGGLPYKICQDGTDERAYLFPIITRFCLSRTNICTEKSFNTNTPAISERDLRHLTAGIISYFDSNIPGVPVVEVMHTFYGLFHIFLSDEVIISKVSQALPRRVADCFVYYHNISELRRPDSVVQQMARRDITPLPTAGVVDDTEYSVMRPGVMVCSEMQIGIVETTLGVAVKDQQGHQYVTVASNSMADDGIVMLPRTEQNIGKVSGYIPLTDIALVELNGDVEFENEPFETFPDVPTAFTRLATDDDVFTSTASFLDSPFSGVMEGVVAATSIQVEDTNHVGYDWHYYGQEEERVCPPNGTCGAPIWNQDGVVMGFYRFSICEGRFARLAASVRASRLKQAGFNLAV